MLSEVEAAISNLQIGVRGRLRMRVLTSEHAHFEKYRPPNLLSISGPLHMSPVDRLARLPR